MKKSKILVTCPKGLPPFLRDEISKTGFPVLSEGFAGVMTEGTLEDTMKLNLFLRTGHRVLFLLEEFEAGDPEDLYRGLLRINWEDYIDEDEYVCVTSSVDHPDIRDSRYANLKGKDAIMDRIRERMGRRPDSGPEKEGVVVYFHWKDRKCSVYLDTSGEPLPKRGYRKIPFRAPMQETLAAAVMAATGWDGSSHFVNPMCGSGTLAIEAALLGLNRAPGLLRTNYGFMHLKGYDKNLWNNLRERARQAARKLLQGRIIATDIDPEAIQSARKNAETAGVGHLIEFRVCDYSETVVPDGGGVVLFNPEYGARMGDVRKLESVYKGIGDFFKQRCRGYTGYIFTGNPELAKKVGLRTKRKITFFNSTIECRLLEYELYEGSRKRKGEVEERQKEEGVF